MKIWLGIQKTFHILFVTGSFDGCPSFEIPTLGIRLDLQLSHYCDHWAENELLQKYWVFLFNVVQLSTFLLNLHPVNQEQHVMWPDLNFMQYSRRFPLSQSILQLPKLPDIHTSVWIHSTCKWLWKFMNLYPVTEWYQTLHISIHSLLNFLL